MDQKKRLNQLADLVYGFLELPSTPHEESVHTGFLIPGENEEVVKLVMERWVAWKDRLLDELEENSEEYAQLFSTRGITFSEYKLLTMREVGEEVIKTSRAFDYFYLLDKTDQIVFTSKIDNEKTAFENYIDLLIPFLKAEIPVLSNFFLTKRLPQYMPIEGMRSHTYLPARSGWGKSQLLALIIYDLQRRSHKRLNRSIIVIEPNSDLVTMLIRFKFNASEQGRKRIIFLDPFIKDTCDKLFYGTKIDTREIVKQDHTFVINPFDLKDRSDKNVNYMAQELKKAFFMIIEDTPSPQMNALLNTCLYVLLKKPGSTLVDLMTLMKDEENEELVEFGCSLPNTIHRNFMKTFRGNKKLASTKSSILYKMHSILSDGNFYRLMVGTSTIDLEKEINSGKVILFNLAKGQMGDESGPAYGKLMMAYISGLIRKRDGKQEHLRKETFFVLDEFQNYINPSLKTIMAESRKYGFHCIFAQQVIGQEMDKEMKDLIMGNTTIKIAGDLEPNGVAEMCKQMPGLSSKAFTKLSRFNFFLYNSQKKEQGVLTLRTPSFLVDQKNPQFYMSDEQLASLMKYFVEESGYYVPFSYNPRGEPDQDDSSEDRTRLLIEPKETLFTPKFQKKHE